MTMTLPQALANRRRADAHTLAQAAEKAQVSLPTYRKWHDGTTVPQPKNFPLLEKYLGISRGALLGLLMTKTSTPRRNDHLAVKVSSASRRSRKIISAVLAAESIED